MRPGMKADPLDPVMHGILRHPEFPAAALDYFEKIIAWRVSLGLFNRIGTNLAMHVVNYAMYLYLGNRAGTIEHGATFSGLLTICEARGQCGPRALRTTLALLQVMGHLRSERVPGDGRVQVYVPSDRLLKETAGVYGNSLGVLDKLFPGSKYAKAAHEDRDFLQHVVAHAGRAVIEHGVRITEHFPELHNIIQQAGGFPTAVTLANAHLRGEAFPSTHTIAKTFKISPSQVRAIISRTAESGLITRSEDGRIIAADKLVACHKGLIARELAVHVKYALGLEHKFLECAA